MKCSKCSKEYPSDFYFESWDICPDCFKLMKPTDQKLVIKEKYKITPVTQKPENSQDTNQKQIIVKTYTGNQTQATQLFQTDLELMAAQGYFPISQSWAPGSYGCGSFLVALALCFILVGFIVFIYMLIVKPDGTLSVSYEFRDMQELIEEKTCPKCAEQVKAAAKICRFCGHYFVPDFF